MKSPVVPVTIVLLTGLAMAALLGQAPRQPNIVVIFADDLGYGDIGAFGAPNIRTPRLDAMAAEGQKWTKLLCPAGVFAEPGGAAHRQAARPQRDVRHSWRNGAQGLPRQRRPGAATRGSDRRRAAQVGGLPDRRWSASGTSASCRSSCRCIRVSTRGSAFRTRTTCE